MARRIVHQGRRITVSVDESTGPNGEQIIRDVIEHPGAVVILPVLKNDDLVLLRNRRFVIGETLWEIPAGTLEAGEALETAAHRELQEETGYTAAKLTSRGYLYASPGVLNEKLHLFIAEDLTAGPPKPEVDEELEAVIVPLHEAVKMVLSGEIKDAKTVTAILLWDRLRPPSGIPF